jgi:hypothetical protein
VEIGAPAFVGEGRIGDDVVELLAATQLDQREEYSSDFFSAMRQITNSFDGCIELFLV